MQIPKLKKLFIYACENTHDFLYIAGIQTIRILKRVGRRTARFLRPVTNLFKRLYNLTVGRQIANLKREIRSVQEGFSINGKALLYRADFSFQICNLPADSKVVQTFKKIGNRTEKTGRSAPNPL